MILKRLIINIRIVSRYLLCSSLISTRIYNYSQQNIQQKNNVPVYYYTQTSWGLFLVNINV